MPRRNLSLLLPNPPTGNARLEPDPMIAGVTEDSRMVAPGHLFAALPSSTPGHASGTEYIENAVALGAAAVLAPTGTPRPSGNVGFITYDNPRLAFAYIAANFYAEQPRMLVAVTGTNGKTSVAQFTRELWAQAGFRAASMGTLGLLAPHITRAGSLTTPDTVALYRDLAMLCENGVTHCIFEASSHGLDQYRLHAARLKIAAFTNLTHDHLDYHGSMEAYRAAKMKLFTEILPIHGIAVVNADTPEFAYVQNDIVRTQRSVVSYGFAGSDVKLLDVKRLGHGQRITVNAWGSDYVVDLPLIGQFQVENALCAAAIVVASGEAPSITFANLANLAPVRGRMELVGATPEGAAVYVDYAHTPDGLRNVLTALRPHTAGKLHLVFGCGGDRDTSKRPIMGRIAAELADIVYITDDNPRTENAAAIRATIRAACPSGKEVSNRAAAIEEAVAGLRAGDVLVIAGKGHEQGQIVDDHTLPFDDADVARFALRNDVRTGTA